jgi:hypothetical protein
MKRDLDLIRKILFQLEAHEHGYAPQTFTVDGYTDEVVGYHVHLMGQAGLLKVADVTHGGSPSPSALPVRLTFAGHDFLDAARSDTIWNHARKAIADTVGSVTLDAFKGLLQGLATAAVRAAVGLPS